jgi:hypothetical protein
MQEQTVQPSAAKKNLIFFWIIAAVLILAIAGGLYWQINAGKTDLPGPEGKEDSRAELPASNWQTYKNNKYGFSLIFPENWENYIVSDAAANWGKIGETDVILFGFEQKKDMFAIYPFSLEQASSFGENKLNPVSFLGPVDYLGESEQYVFYSESSQAESDGDLMPEKFNDIKSILNTFSLK